MNTPKLEDEIKFRELLKNPLRLFGWIFPLFIILVLGLGIYFVKNLTAVSYNEQAVGIQDSANVKTEIILKKGGIVPSIDLAIVKSPSPEFINKGKELFNANCKSCHGENGMGDGTAGAMLNPKPRNFHAVDGWTNGREIENMYKTLQEGIIKNGMAAYEYLPPADRFAIISYIRTFGSFPEIKDETLTSLDQQYQLSKGTVVPNQIPVATAKIKIEEENAAIIAKIEKVKSSIMTAQDPASQLLRRVTFNLEKVLNSFTSSKMNSNLDAFSQMVLADPINYGFKPTVSQSSREEFKQLFDYLTNITK